MKNPLLIILLVLLFMVLLFIFYKQNGTAKTKKTTKAAKASSKKNHHPNQESIEGGSPDWVDQVNQSVSDPDQQDWEWGGSSSAGSTTSVSAQEVDPLTEYQVYKQFGYESKAAESLAGYLNGLNDGAPEKLVHELVGLSLRVGNIDILPDALSHHGANVLRTARHANTSVYFDSDDIVEYCIGNNFHAAVRLGSVWFGLGAIDCFGGRDCDFADYITRTYTRYF